MLTKNVFPPLHQLKIISKNSVSYFRFYTLEGYRVTQTYISLNLSELRLSKYKIIKVPLKFRLLNFIDGIKIYRILCL